MIHKPALAAAVALVLSAPVLAGEADVLDASIDPDGRGTYRVTVTVRHADTGWDHYADAWDVLAPDGTVLATRTLFHPHVNEQPFTRSLSGVEIPAEIAQVIIRAHDSVDGYGGAELTVDVPH